MSVAVATLERPASLLVPLTRLGSMPDPVLVSPTWVPAAVTGLCRGLADGEAFRVIRSRAWLLAGQIHGGLNAAASDHDATLARLDAIAACWRYAQQLERGWDALRAQDWAHAMERAGRATATATELEDEHHQGRSLCERLRARARALWHLADGFDEVSFLLDSDDADGARQRAAALAAQAEQLFHAGLLGEDEREDLEDLLGRWRLAPTWRAGAWAP
ncbi:MAG: hypothetical protein ABIO70_26220 [Pseudomonadota bacterium]